MFRRNLLPSSPFPKDEDNSLSEFYVLAPVRAASQQQSKFFYVSLTVHRSITLANDQLDAQTFLIHLLKSPTCFKQ